MKWNKTIPCDSCPFRRVGGVRLAEGRCEEITEHDGEFPCHKTTVSDDDSEDGDMKAAPDSQMCAGFLILREKMEQPNQPMRIAERIGMYDARALMANNKVVGEVFDDLDEMIEVNEADRHQRQQKRKAAPRGAAR